MPDKFTSLIVFLVVTAAIAAMSLLFAVVGDAPFIELLQLGVLGAILYASIAQRLDP